MEHLRVVLADDHAFVLLGIRFALSEHSDITINGEADNPAALIDLLQRVPCDVLVTDLTMPDPADAAEDGVALIRRIRHDWPALRVVVLSGVTHAGMLRALIEDGVLGVLNKAEPMSDLADAIRAVGAGRTYLGGTIRHMLQGIESTPDGMVRMQRLSQRESEVVGLFAQGQSMSEIAVSVGRDVRSVAREKRFAMTKLGVTNDPGLFAYVRAHKKPDS